MLLIAVSGLVALLVWNEDEMEKYDEYDCNELWDIIVEHEEEYRTVEEYAFSKWLVKECWS